MHILIASGNPHKIQELKSLLADMPGLECAGPDGDSSLPVVEEDGATFRENAVKKAMAYARASGLLTVADDSGLCVDALSGEPGVYSARYAGPEQNARANCDKLLRAMRGIPEEKRTARFECWIALAKPGNLVTVVSGLAVGRILEEFRGLGGFGYDPIFLYPPLNKTFAEISPSEKNRVSHRAEALRKLKAEFRTIIVSGKKSLDN